MRSGNSQAGSTFFSTSKLCPRNPRIRTSTATSSSSSIAWANEHSLCPVLVKELPPRQPNYIMSTHGECMEHQRPSLQTEDQNSSQHSRMNYASSQVSSRSTLQLIYHPQTDGNTEILNQYIDQRLRPFVNHFQDNWSDLLPAMEFAQAILPHESTGLTTYELVTVCIRYLVSH